MHTGASDLVGLQLMWNDLLLTPIENGVVKRCPDRSCKLRGSRKELLSSILSTMCCSCLGLSMASNSPRLLGDWKVKLVCLELTALRLWWCKKLVNCLNSCVPCCRVLLART